MCRLSDEQYKKIAKDVSVVSVSSPEISELSRFVFNCGEATEYRDFLYEDARRFETLNISRTFLLIHNASGELIGYFSLAADSVKLTAEEKELSDLAEVNFSTIPAMKLGKLAINSKFSHAGYGSFVLDIVDTYAFEASKAGVACRFVTVDADIEYNPRTTEFYEKNGFVVNSSKKRRASDKTVSMRRDIF